MKAGRLAVKAITLDFGNTLARVDRRGYGEVIAQTADALAMRGVVHDRDGFLSAWAEERERQFREEVPEFREVDIEQRAIRVLARLRGMEPPPPDARWDDSAAAADLEQPQVDSVVDAYSLAFVEGIEPVADALPTLEGLAGRGFRLAILSNWPLALTIDHFAEAHGWTRYLRSIVVSQRVGTIKPHLSIFRAAELALGLAPSDAASILHVGDDWAADVVGASQAGWRTAYLRDRQHDTPLPTSTRGEGLASGDDAEAAAPVTADLEIDELSELDALVDLAGT